MQNLQIIIFILIVLTPINLGKVKMSQQASQNSVTIYTTTHCPYCVKAKMLLEQKGVKYNQINIETSPEIRQEMILKAGGKKTVPQIFIGDLHVGGCDDLHNLEATGKLDNILFTLQQ